MKFAKLAPIQRDLYFSCLKNRFKIVLILMILPTFQTEAAIPTNKVMEIKNIADKLDKKHKPIKEVLTPTNKKLVQKKVTIKKQTQRMKAAKEKYKKTSSKSHKKIFKYKKNAKKVFRRRRTYSSVSQPPSFDLPITYNSKVKRWIIYFQTNGRSWFKKRLERSYRYLPKIQFLLDKRGLPQDLGYIAMIESGFSPRAVSSAQAVGYWQFIKGTANRYGLQTKWWIDERRDFTKSTNAAASYLGDLYKMFNSWYLSAAAYNMGENRVKRLIRKHKTRNFWVLSKKYDFPKETREYIPKLIAAMIIAKAPALYGFRNLKPLAPYRYHYFNVPGGTDLYNLADYLGINQHEISQLNPELVKGFVPKYIDSHRIRIPKGLIAKASSFIKEKYQ